jgi:hypothetical protein
VIYAAVVGKADVICTLDPDPSATTGGSDNRKNRSEGLRY